METIELGRIGRKTTRLGFGCGSVMGVLGRTDSLAMLESAFDAGIRHFDVAPAYGYGEAEGCMGEFLARHAGEFTVATKFGIPASSGRSLKGIARKIARPLLKSMPGLKKSLPGVAVAVAHSDTHVRGPNPIFSAEKARTSIEKSLAALKVDNIDILLLHEARAMDLNDDGMLRLFEDFVAAGTIGAFGVGSEGSKIPALLEKKPAYCHVLQYEWSVLDAMIPASESFRLHHRSLTQHFRSLHEALTEDPLRRRRWSEHCGADISDAATLASLMLKAAMLCNPQSVVLFSSKRLGNVAKNARLVDDHSLDENAMRFYGLVRAEMPWEAGAKPEAVGSGSPR